MPFDPETFASEVALKLIPTEAFPSVAQDAMEQGLDGPCVVRMAILDPRYGWAIDQALSPMLQELGVVLPNETEAALHLAKRRAEQLLASGEDPIPSLHYFYRLTYLGDYPRELIPLAYIEDEFHVQSYAPHEQRELVTAYLEELISPELRDQRDLERETSWELRQQKVRSDWPYKFDSPGRTALLRSRIRDRFADTTRSLLVLLLGAAVILGWAVHSAVVTVGFVVLYPPLLFGVAYWAEYRRLKRERCDILRRRNVPEDQI